MSIAKRRVNQWALRLQICGRWPAGCFRSRSSFDFSDWISRRRWWYNPSWCPDAMSGREIHSPGRPGGRRRRGKTGPKNRHPVFRFVFGRRCKSLALYLLHPETPRPCRRLRDKAATGIRSIRSGTGCRRRWFSPPGNSSRYLSI